MLLCCLLDALYSLLVADSIMFVVAFLMLLAASHNPVAR